MPDPDPHWSARYLGRPWLEGEWECTDLVSAAVRVLGGPAVAIPRPARSASARDAQVQAEQRGMWRRTDSPAEGDVALMRPGRVLAWHVGVGVRQPEGIAVLHVDRERGTVLDSVSWLARWGLAVEGWYRCA